MKRLGSILVGATMATLLFAGAAMAKTYTVKIAHYASPTHPVTKSVEYFKEMLERESKGAFKVQHFPNNQLGSEDTFIDQVRRGTIQVAVSGTMIRKDEPNIGLIDTPFVIDSWEMARAVYQGDGISILTGDYTKNTGVHIMGFFINGFRQVSSKEPINAMGDFGKLKLRTPNNEIYVKLFQALGCNTVMLPMSEVYNALETRVVDAQENPYATLKGTGWWEVQGAVLETHHVFSTSPFLVNGKFFGKLPKDMQEVFTKCVKAAVEHNWKISEEEDNAARAFMKEKGLTVVTPTPEFKQEISATLKDFYAWYATYLPASKDWIAYCNSKRPQ